MYLLDAISGKIKCQLEGHDKSVNAVAWSPDSGRIATASDDKTARVWDAATGRERLTLHGSDLMLSVAWSPDGSRLATGSLDRTVTIWDAGSGRERLTLVGHDSLIGSIAWNPDGTRLATASADLTVRVMSMMTIDDLMAAARQRWRPEYGELSVEGCKKYLHTEQCPPFPELPWW